MLASACKAIPASHLELLTIPYDGVAADERTAEGKDRLVDVQAAFVADRRPPELVQPGQGPFDDPAVAAQALAGIDALARDADPDPAAAQEAAAAGDVVGLVGVELGRARAALPGGPLDRRDGVDQFLG